MMTPQNVYKSGLTLTANQIFIHGCSFVRNIIIARLVSPADFGIAALFAITFSLIDMISNLAAERLLIQAEDGNEHSLQNIVHLLQAGRGIANAILIFLSAGLISALFGVPQAKWAFQCLALVPLLRGFAHTDVFRPQRDLKFAPSIIVDVSSNAVATLAALPLALWLRDYHAMLWILVAQSLCTAVGSHLVAERRYRWGWNRLYLERIFSFGWPLLINGLLMFLIFQGDRFTIGAAHQIFQDNSYTLADLGIYAVAFELTMAPATVISNVASSLFLPILSRAQNSRRQFEKRYLACSQGVSLAAAMIAVPFIIVGGKVVTLVYGEAYAAAAPLIGWLAGMWALRTLRVSPTVAAVALSDTKTVLISNIVRTFAFVGVFLVAAIGLNLAWIAACGFFGELLALIMCVMRLRVVHGIPAMIFAKPCAIAVTAMMSAAAALALGVVRHGWAAPILASAILIVLLCFVMFSFYPDFRRDVRALVFRSESSTAT